MHEEREARLVHRIESFSDLVMGFSLALLGLTLVIPAHASELLAHPWWLAGYFWTFVVIGSIWFNHQRLFGHFFVPSMPSIIINFVMLSMLGLIVYFVQVFGHMNTDADRALAFLWYFAALGLAIAAIGSLYAIGTHARWRALEPQTRAQGIRHAARGLVLGLVILAVVVYEAYAPGARTMTEMLPFFFAALIASVVVRVALRYIEPRIRAGEHA